MSWNSKEKIYKRVCTLEGRTHRRSNITHKYILWERFRVLSVKNVYGNL